ncbi:MAG TPA: PilZ domain-containing protein [Candidatus Sulfotelmatobacter sp.]
MTLESLLLSCDVALIRMLRPILEKLAIEVEVCQEGRKATDVLISEKFDAIIVDCDDLKGGIEVLQGIRTTPTNKNSVVFAVLNGKKTTTQEAFAMGANFVLQKPISTLNATRCFNAALNSMVRERRRYFRQPVKMTIGVRVEDTEIKVISTNLSEGGVAVKLRHALPKNATPRLTFSLPGTNTTMNLESEIAWVDMKGYAGFRFRNVPESSQQALEKWLDAHVESDLAAIGDAKHTTQAEMQHPQAP